MDRHYITLKIKMKKLPSTSVTLESSMEKRWKK